jgi:mannosyltransferase OCH1-like enzyme
MIPKIIHYCWFGGNQLPDIALKCIDSWKKNFPDYEIKEWNENNFNVDSCDYVKEAYQEKKWAFVSDYARFKILYEYGGLYFDTDVEVIKDMTDILAKGPFMGRERIANIYPVNTGLGLAASPRMPIFKEIIDHYENSHFIQLSKMETVVERVTNILKKHGLSIENQYETVEGFQIYPSEYFCPYDYNTGKLNVTNNTKSIHWYDASWFDSKMRRRRSICVKIQKTFKGRMGEQLAKYYTRLSYYWEWISSGDFATIKQKIANKIHREK